MSTLSLRSARLERALALTMAAVPLFVVASTAPLMRLEDRGHGVVATLPGAVLALHRQDLVPLAGLVLLTLILLPALELVGLTYLLVQLRRSLPVPARVERALEVIRPWSQMEIFLLGMLVAFGKLTSVFPVSPSVGCAALAGYLVLSRLARWSLARAGAQPSSARKPDSLSRTAAFLVAAAVLFVPANLLPVMTTRTLLRADSDTILSGVAHLWKTGAWPLALLVFVASIVVPGLKILALALLVVSSWLRSGWRRAGRARLYRVIEWVGRWSMLDIFVMAVLAVLVRSPMASVEIDAGAVAFAAVVVLTMTASASFDPRLIWDRGVRHD
jgi:paraquat-inducible protein A